MEGQSPGEPRKVLCRARASQCASLCCFHCPLVEVEEQAECSYRPPGKVGQLWRLSEAGADEQAECSYRPPGKVVTAVEII